METNINNYIAQQIRQNFPYEPTEEQADAMKGIASFVSSTDTESLFVLRGYAGTGKTLLVAALVKTMQKFTRKTVLLAPTGRAAKVFSSYASHPAFTIHKYIYRQKRFSSDVDDFTLNINLSKDTLFIVDEASMISNSGLSGHLFGSGRLLDDLIQFVYNGNNCKLILIGDTAQLPPIGENESPALSRIELLSYGMHLVEKDLVQVVRQKQKSGILFNSSTIRTSIQHNKYNLLPKITLKGFRDIQRLSGEDLIPTLSNCYDNDGLDETVVICRSNKRANLYNNGIRTQILYREEELETGDVLMIAKNNYFWTEHYKDTDFIANGENAIVRRVRHSREIYGFHFVDVTLLFPNYDDLEIDATLLLDTLHSETPALSTENSERLFKAVFEDYSEIPLKHDKMKKIKADPYYNALQVKYAYAITCHKAQGGQWKNVFLDQAYIPPNYITPEYFRWLYTAFTRATGTLYLINYPEEQTK
ncbi:MAG: AAA family ATPase [Bacteroidales bacterium]|nr:AAA family ATPase [Bacteroidales bacterium]